MRPTVRVPQQAIISHFKGRSDSLSHNIVTDTEPKYKAFSEGGREEEKKKQNKTMSNNKYNYAIVYIQLKIFSQHFSNGNFKHKENFH